MTGTSDALGNVAGTDFGPYLQQIPTNSFNGLDTLDNTGTAGDGVAGWEYNETTGAINADDDVDAAHATY